MDVGGLREEAKEQGHSEVGYRKVLKQQFRLTRPKSSVERGKHLRMEMRLGCAWGSIWMRLDWGAIGRRVLCD